MSINTIQNVGLYVHCYCISADNQYLSMSNLSKFAKLCIIS
jgi:hypothetical protein